MQISSSLAGLLLAISACRSSAMSLDQPFTSSFARLAHAACVSLFHRNGRVGCGTESRSLQIGKLMYYDGSLPDTEENYVMVIEEVLLDGEAIDTLIAAKGGLLQGVLVLNSTSDDDSSDTHTYVSPDSVTPRGSYTPSYQLNYGDYTYQWNPKGTNLFEYDLYGLPMAYVLDSDVSQSLRADSQSSSTDDSIVAEFDYYMGQDGLNSKQCLAWKDVNEEWSPKCLPLGGTSVWATGGSPSNPSKGHKRDLNEDHEGEGRNGRRNVVMLTAGMDSTSLFHDVAPGANSAASNILTILMAAKLIGTNMNDETLDGLNKRIAFALFEGESYGFTGSRSFLRDVAYPGFQCNSSPVQISSKVNSNLVDYACLSPMRPSMQFANLGQIAGMISVDQVGHMIGEGLLYVHADGNNDSYGSFLASILKYSGTQDVSVASTSAESDDGYPYPPSPLTSLLQLSEGGVGGAVLTGYDYAYTRKFPYHSHRDSATLNTINLNAIAAAATITARAAVAAAYDDGSYDYETASQYANNIIPEMSSDDETFVTLADCLLYNGGCDLLKKYSSTEVANLRHSTGLSLGNSYPFDNPPNYYVSIYNGAYGQPFVQVGDNIYGAYNGEDFGKKKSDTVGLLPRQLESAIHGLFDDFLGRGSVEGDAVSCSKLSDCSGVEYCDAYGDAPTCTGGGQCVCRRAHYHIALDEALLPAENKPTGYFEIYEYDTGVSPIYTEPFWSPSVGVRVYRDVGTLPGFFTLVAGVATAGMSLFGAFVLKIGLRKQKLY